MQHCLLRLFMARIVWLLLNMILSKSSQQCRWFACMQRYCSFYISRSLMEVLSEMHLVAFKKFRGDFARCSTSLMGSL